MIYHCACFFGLSSGLHLLEASWIPSHGVHFELRSLQGSSLFFALSGLQLLQIPPTAFASLLLGASRDKEHWVEPCFSSACAPAGGQAHPPSITCWLISALYNVSSWPHRLSLANYASWIRPVEAQSQLSLACRTFENHNDINVWNHQETTASFFCTS